MTHLIIFIVFYIIGSVSPAVITGRIVKGIDIRDVNSKNAGASNVTITLGVKYGALVAFSDLFKGLIPIIILRFIFPENETLWFVGGIGAVIGHVYPFYLRFRGGKGTATFVGVLLGGAPLIGILLMITLIVVTVLSDYIAIGTLFLIVLAPISLYIQDYHYPTIIIVSLISMLSVYKHSSNFIRIYKREEKGLRTAFPKNQKST